VTRPARVLLVGNPAPTHVGGHLVAAARDVGLELSCLDSTQAYQGAWLTRQVGWRLGGRRPVALKAFARSLEEAVDAFAPDMLLATGIAPLERDTLEQVASRGITTANYLTDDPWNPSHVAPWFLRALPAYQTVFSPRHANLNDLERLGGPVVRYLPFAYSPHVHYPERAPDEDRRQRFAADVAFAGGADDDRVAAVAPLMEAGLSVGLYGGYWDRYRQTRAMARGFVDAPGLRHAIAEAGIALGLVRRANRDGHAMRSFEMAAMGACMLVEDTPEHRDLFGEDLETVKYFGAGTNPTASVRWLLAHETERRRLGEAVRVRTTAGRHTYADRLATIVEEAVPVPA